jgi:membrane protein required for colicin V production
MNPFDAVIYGLTLVAIVMGFRSGLLRSLAAIFGYLAATAVAVALTPKLEPLVGERLTLPGITMPGGQNALLFGLVFLVAGIVLSGLLRLIITETTGAQIGATDRVAGAMLGAIRIILIAIVLVMIFERVVPPGNEPEFLKTSRLRPVLSTAGASGLRSLPPDVTDYIDRLKRERGL